MSDSVRAVTADELEHFPDDDCRYELVEGRLRRMSPVGGQHGDVVVRLVSLLHGHVRSRRLGKVFTEVGFKLASSPDTVRAPDVAFVQRSRMPSPLPRGFLSGSPDVAIEVISPDDRLSEVQAKVDDYLAHGVVLVLVLDPDEKTATVFRRLMPPVTVGDPDTLLDLTDVIPEFCVTLRDLFDS